MSLYCCVALLLSLEVKIFCIISDLPKEIVNFVRREIMVFTSLQHFSTAVLLYNMQIVGT